MAVKKKKKGMIYYPPLTPKRITTGSLYPLVYSYFLHQGLSVFQKEPPGYYDLILCEKEQKEQLKKAMADGPGVQFGALPFPLDKKIRETFIGRLIKELDRKGMISRKNVKGHYCPRCGRVIEDYETLSCRETHQSFVMKMNVTASAEPLIFTFTDPLALLYIKAVGVRNMEKYADRKGIVPILGHHIPILKIDDINRPEYYTRYYSFDFLYESQKEKEVSSKLLSQYNNDRSRLLSDLASYGALAQAMEQDVDVVRCRQCGSLTQNLLAEHLVVSGEKVEMVLGEPPKSAPFILTSHEGWPDSHPGPVTFPFRLCPSCSWAGDEGEKCPLCGAETKSSDLLFNDHLRNLLLPLLWENQVDYLVLLEEEKAHVAERLSFFEKIMMPESAKYENRIIVLDSSRIEGEQGVPAGLAERSPLSFLRGDDENEVVLTDRGVHSFLNRWERLFNRKGTDEPGHVDIRTDFYIDKLILTELEEFILEGGQALVSGELFAYLKKLAHLMFTLDRRVYPFLKKIQADEDPAVFKNCSYAFGIIKYCLAPLAQTDSGTGYVPVYREDYHFREELNRDHIILDLIDRVMDGKSILNISPDEPLDVFVTSPGGGLEDILNRNMFYITRFLNITELKFASGKEIPRKSLKLSVDKWAVYIPVYDKSRIAGRLEDLMQQRRELDRRILEKRSLLFNFDFLKKASPDIVDDEEEKASELLVAKEKLNGYIKLLTQWEREGRNGGTKPIQKTT